MIKWILAIPFAFAWFFLWPLATVLAVVAGITVLLILVNRMGKQNESAIRGRSNPSKEAPEGRPR